MKKKSSKIKVEIATEEKINQEFITQWKQAERGKQHITTEKLYFLDVATLLSVLSDKRLALLQTLHELGACSIRALGQTLKRDYKNVFQDVQLLKHAGLIEDNKAREIYVPWDKIQTEINLAA